MQFDPWRGPADLDPGVLACLEARDACRAWGGQPRVNDTEVQTNPLGPLQDIGPALVIGR